MSMKWKDDDSDKLVELLLDTARQAAQTRRRHLTPGAEQRLRTEIKSAAPEIISHPNGVEAFRRAEVGTKSLIYDISGNGDILPDMIGNAMTISSVWPFKKKHPPAEGKSGKL